LGLVDTLTLYLSCTLQVAFRQDIQRQKMEKSKISKMAKSWQRVSKGMVLDLFAFWLPKQALPSTKKQAIEVFCEQKWEYVEDEVETALAEYAIYRKNDDDEELEGKMSEFTPKQKSKKRQRTGITAGPLTKIPEEEEKSLSPIEEKEEEEEHKTEERSSEDYATLMTQMRAMQLRLDSIQPSSSSGDQHLCDELAAVFPNSLLKVTKLTKGERKKLVKNMPKYSNLPKVIDKTEGDCLEKVKNRKVKTAIATSWPLIQRQNLMFMQLGMYGRTLLRSDTVDQQLMEELERVFVAVSGLAVDNARGNLAHMKKLLHEELGLRSVLESKEGEEVFFGKKDLEIVSRHSEFDRQIRFRQSKDKPFGSSRFQGGGGGKFRGRGRFRGGGGQQFNPYKKNHFYGNRGGRGSYNGGNRGSGSSRGRGSFGNKTGRYNKEFNPQARGDSQ
jgi:hypothetical protein